MTAVRYTRRDVLRVAGGALALLAAPARASLQLWSGRAEAPPIELFTPSGKALALADLRGRVVLVNFWATWCEPCIEEMPSMQRLRDRLGAARFEILAVNFQEGPGRIQGFLDKARLSFPVVRDTDGAVTKAWGVRIFPSSFIVDTSGRIRYTLTGAADWTSAAVETKIRALLNPAA